MVPEVMPVVAMTVITRHTRMGLIPTLYLWWFYCPDVHTTHILVMGEFISLSKQFFVCEIFFWIRNLYPMALAQHTADCARMPTIYPYIPWWFHCRDVYTTLILVMGEFIRLSKQFVIWEIFLWINILYPMALARQTTDMCADSHNISLHFVVILSPQRLYHVYPSSGGIHQVIQAFLHLRPQTADTCAQGVTSIDVIPTIFQTSIKEYAGRSCSRLLSCLPTTQAWCSVMKRLLVQLVSSSEITRTLAI